MDKHAVALVLSEIATLLEIHGENKFKVRAYSAAARAIEAAEEDVVTLARAGRLEELAGVGSATRSVVEELVKTGGSRMHERLREKTPAGFYELLRVPHLGPGRIHTLHEKLGIETVAELEAAAREGRVAALKGFGPKTQSAILEGIAFVRGASARRLLPRADEAAYRVLGFLESRSEVRDVKLAGALRRRMETVEAVDVIAAVPGRCDDLLSAFLALPGVARGERVSGDVATAWLSDGFQLRVRCTSLAAFAAAWAWETGGEAHVAGLVARARKRGLELRADGLFDKGKRVRVGSEEALYEKLGLAWVPPELREGLGEVEQAAK
ncbi:MAG TPA: helix-hairpin-helix domain-containing protein, partial [Longimicrobiales bacterium]|nr:helix-hairpin-helix domain-containing protein [Longimicrobiales bacterium]